jgi:hypothetical protein
MLVFGAIGVDHATADGSVPPAAKRSTATAHRKPFWHALDSSVQLSSTLLRYQCCAKGTLALFEPDPKEILLNPLSNSSAR